MRSGLQIRLDGIFRILQIQGALVAENFDGLDLFAPMQGGNRGSRQCAYRSGFFHGVALILLRSEAKKQDWGLPDFAGYPCEKTGCAILPPLSIAV